VGGFGSIIYEGVTGRFSPHRWRSEGAATHNPGLFNDARVPVVPPLDCDTVRDLKTVPVVHPSPIMQSL